AHARQRELRGGLDLLLGAGRELHPLQLADGAVDIRQGDRSPVCGVGRHHRGITQRVDETWNAAREAEDLRESVRGEDLPIARPGDLQAVLDVALSLGL